MVKKRQDPNSRRVGQDASYEYFSNGDRRCLRVDYLGRVCRRIMGGNSQHQIDTHNLRFHRQGLHYQSMVTGPISCQESGCNKRPINGQALIRHYRRDHGLSGSSDELKDRYGIPRAQRRASRRAPRAPRPATRATLPASQARGAASNQAQGPASNQVQGPASNQAHPEVHDDEDDEEQEDEEEEDEEEPLFVDDSYDPPSRKYDDEDSKGGNGDGGSGLGGQILSANVIAAACA